MKKRVKMITTVNDLTGEVLDQRSVFASTADPEPPFVKVYHSGMADLTNLCETDMVILTYFFEHCSERHPEIIINGYVRKLIAEKAQCTTHNIDYCMRKLMDHGLILRIERGVYILNPFKLAKGYWSSISSLRERARVYLDQKPEHASQTEKAPTD